MYVCVFDSGKWHGWGSVDIAPDSPGCYTLVDVNYQIIRLTPPPPPKVDAYIVAPS